MIPEISDNYGCLKISDELCLPKEVAQEVTLITGSRGSGKSNLAGVFMEELNKNNMSFICFDTLGAHRFMKLPSVRVVDVPRGSTVNPKSLVDTVVTGNQSVILNMLDMPFEQQQTLVARFAEEILAARPGRYGKTVTVIVEEAQLFAPSGNARYIYDSIMPLDNLTKTGRAYGIGVVYVTQRPQDFSMRLRSQTANFFILNLRNPNELKLVKEHVSVATLKEAAAVVHDVHNFSPGDALVISPHVPKPGMLIVHVRERETEHGGKNILGDSPIFDTPGSDAVVSPRLMNPMPANAPMVFGGSDDIKEILIPSKPKKRFKPLEYAAIAMGVTVVGAVVYIMVKGYRDNVNKSFDEMEHSFSQYSAQLKDAMDPKKKPASSSPLPKKDNKGLNFDEIYNREAHSHDFSIVSDFGKGPRTDRGPRNPLF